MKELYFETQGTNTYLVCELEEDDILDTMSLGMLTNNKIPGLAQTQFMQMDAAKYIKYNVSAKVSVRQFFEGAVNKKRLLGVFTGIVNGLLAAEDYMIDMNSLLLDLDHIYADVSTCEAFLICLPVCDTQAAPLDLGGFFKNIMFTTQFDQTENCDHVARIINFLNSAPVFSLQDFKALLDTIRTGPAPAATPGAQAVRREIPVAPQPKPAPQPQPQPQPAPQPQPVQPQPAPRPVPPQPQPQINIPGQAAQQPAAPAGKQMSMVDLLSHYSKENLAIYKAQQAAKKAGASAAKVQAPAATAPQKKGKKEKKGKAQPAPMGFAVPGQAPAAPAAPKGAPVGFAVPGQTPAAPAAPKGAPVGFAVPGQTPAAPKAAPQRPVTPPQPAPQAAPAPQAVPQPAYMPPQPPQGHAMNFGETVVLGGGASLGGTVVLGQNPAQQVTPHLIRAKTSEKIPLNKPVFRVGKESSYVDYFIGDNPAVSRSHATFLTKDGAYFIMDTNSTNHTHVNGLRIEANQEVQLNHGDKVRLANEEFEFKLY